VAAHAEPAAEWWASIAHAFQAHVRNETELIESYRALLSRVEDDSARILLEMILDDETRHHELFARMAEAARAAAADDGRRRSAADPELLAATERFLDAEREDREQLRALRRDLRPSSDEHLWRLLVEVMEMDTDKHVKVLEHLRDRFR
jgi:rubrerythrin